MKICVVLCFAFTLCAQVPGDTVIATVNGQKMTAQQFEQIVAALDPQSKAAAQRQPEAFLQQWAMFQTLLSEAEKAKIDQRSPYKERLAESRRQILIQALLDENRNGIVITPEQGKKIFEANHDRYFQAKAKVIFISRASETKSLATGKVVGTLTPEQAKLKAESVVKRARAGEDFVKLAQETSDDGSTADKGADFPEPIRPNSANIPQGIREAILGTKAGGIVGPIEHETGFYIFRVESIGMPAFEQVKEDIYKELKDAAMQKWIEEMRQQSTVKVEDRAFFAPKQGIGTPVLQ